MGVGYTDSESAQHFLFRKTHNFLYCGVSNLGSLDLKSGTQPSRLPLQAETNCCHQRVSEPCAVCFLCLQLSVEELAVSYNNEKAKLEEMMPDHSMSAAGGNFDRCIFLFFFVVVSAG